MFKLSPRNGWSFPDFRRWKFPASAWVACTCLGRCTSGACAEEVRHLEKKPLTHNRGRTSDILGAARQFGREIEPSPHPAATGYMPVTLDPLYLKITYPRRERERESKAERVRKIHFLLGYSVGQEVVYYIGFHIFQTHCPQLQNIFFTKVCNAFCHW